MRITFQDNSYIEFQKSKTPYNVHVIIASKSKDNPLQLVVNSAELELNQLLECVKSVTGPLILENKEKQNE